MIEKIKSQVTNTDINTPSKSNSQITNTNNVKSIYNNNYQKTAQDDLIEMQLNILRKNGIDIFDSSMEIPAEVEFLDKFKFIDNEEIQRLAIDFCKNYDTLKDSKSEQLKFGIDDYNYLKSLYDNKNLELDTGKIRAQNVSQNYTAMDNEIIKIIDNISNFKAKDFLVKFVNQEDANIQQLAIDYYNNYDKLNNSKYEQKKFGLAEYNILSLLYDNPQMEYKGIKYDGYYEKDFYLVKDTESRLVIRIQKDFDSNATQYDLNKAIETFKKLKESNFYSPKLEQISFTSVASPSDKYWQSIYKNSSHHCAADGGFGEINIYKYCPNTDFLGTLTHEMGHITDDHYSYSGSAEYMEAIKKDGNSGVTAYATQALRSLGVGTEDFAESFRLIQLHGENYFKSRFPNRYEYFKNNFSQIFEE